MFGWKWKSRGIKKVSLYKFTYIPLLKNDAVLKQKSDIHPHTHPKKKSAASQTKKKKKKKNKTKHCHSHAPRNQKNFFFLRKWQRPGE